jgi:hypothetical protein
MSRLVEINNAVFCCILFIQNTYICMHVDRRTHMYAYTNMYEPQTNVALIYQPP